LISSAVIRRGIGSTHQERCAWDLPSIVYSSSSGRSSEFHDDVLEVPVIITTRAAASLVAHPTGRSHPHASARRRSILVCASMLMSNREESNIEGIMRNLMAMLTLALSVASMPVFAADEKKSTAQQDKMTRCNKEAADMKGDERKAFMSKCLSATRQEKMTKCNKEAAGKKGDERKAFMSECLKG
jgi:hypothetical protein